MQHSFFILFSNQSQVYLLGSNYNNRRADLDIATKKVSPVEQLLIYQSCYICIPVKVFTRDAWRRLKLICGAWILQKGERHSGIYEAMCGVICLLIYAWPVNFFFHLVKTSGIPRNLVGNFLREMSIYNRRCRRPSTIALTKGWRSKRQSFYSLRWPIYVLAQLWTLNCRIWI